MKRGDNLIPSFESSEVERIRGLAYKFPDTREAEIHDMKIRVSGGQYRVNAEQVARRIIQNGIYVLSILRSDGYSPP